MKVAEWVPRYVLLILTLCSGAQQSDMDLPQCLARRHQFYSKTLKRCSPCRTCSRGWGLRPAPQDIQTTRKNGALTCFRCERCEKGVTYSSRNDYSLCTPCSNCAALSRIVRSRCKRSKNAICGECKPGYHDFIEKIVGKTNTTWPCQHCSYAATGTPECPKTTPTGEVLGPYATSQAPRNTTSTTGASGLHQQPKSYSKNGPLMLPIVASVGAVLIACGVGAVIWNLRRRRTPPSHEHQTVVYSDIMQRDLQGTVQPTPEEGMTEGCDVNDRMTRMDTFSRNSIEITDLKRQIQPNLPDNHKTGYDVKLTLEQKMRIRAVGHRWKELARMLEVDINQLHLADYDDEGEKIHQVLLHWERRFPDHSTALNAYRVLILLGEKDIADSILNKVKLKKTQSVL